MMDIASRVGVDVQRFSGRTILITGAAGFLGRHFLTFFKHINEHVLPRPCRVIAVDNYITEAKLLEGDENIIALWGDVTYPLPIREPVHFILSAAGIASPVYYRKHQLETIDVAVQGTRHMLELARRQDDFEGFLFFSSSEIYGDPLLIPTPETYLGNVSCTGPRACYDESKRLGETLVQIYYQQFGVPAKVVRPFNVFGPGMQPSDRRVIPMFTREALHHRPIPIFLGGKQTRTFCYIDDAIVGFLKVLLNGRSGEAYNIGNPDNEVSMGTLGEWFNYKLGAELSFVPYPDAYPSSEPMRRCPSLEKAKNQLGYEAITTIDRGLDQFVRWARTISDYNPTDTQ